MSYFRFKGVHSDSMGLIVNSYPPIVRAQQRVETTKVPGKHGEVTLLGGPPVFEAYTRSCQCMIGPGADIPALSAWLSGRGDLVMGNEPNYVYQAALIDAIPFDKILREREHRGFSLGFLCQPLKRLAETEQDITLTASGGFVQNPGHVRSRPLMQVTGSGTIRIMLGQESITMISGLGGTILIDSEVGIATNTTKTVNMSPMVSGDWPAIPVGKVPISWTGAVSKIVITPRWRWL